MDERKPRLIRQGLPQKADPRRMAIFLVLVMMSSIAVPVNADVSIARDDFGVLDALVQTLADREQSGESVIAIQGADNSLAYVDAAARPTTSSDALSEADGYLDDVEMRDASPFETDHPKPYQFLIGEATHPDGWPYNLYDTLFSTEQFSSENLLGIGINTYAIYVNFSSKNNGPSYEAWDSGTFTGEIFTASGGLTLFENYIDVDGDGTDDLSVGLTVEGITTLGEGIGVEFSDDIIPIIEELWIRPTFKWKVTTLNQNDPLWNELAHLEVSLMKGLAFDITFDDSESYAIVIDTRFTQPPSEFSLGVGIQKMTFDLTSAYTSAFQLIAALIGGQVNSSELALTSVSAPYALRIVNPNHDSSNLQTDCQDDDDYYDPINDHLAESRMHKCGFGVGIGYVHFGQQTTGQAVPVLELAYIDAGFHPESGSTLIPGEVDLTLRNDNFGKNSFDTVEIYSDTGADIFVHYFEDRSEVPEGDLPFGNITDSRAWIRGLPSGTLHNDEIDAIFTMIGEAPGSANLPGDMPTRLSLIIAIKNFTDDKEDNVNDPTLPVNPSSPPNTLIAIVGTESIDRLEYKSTFMRGGYANDSSSLQLAVDNLPKAIVVQGSFLVPSSGLGRINFDNPNLNTVAQVFDNALLSIVEIILDIGDVVNGLPSSIVGTAGSSGGEVNVNCYNQIKQSLPTSIRESMEIGNIELAISSSDQPWLPEMDHILLSQNMDMEVVAGRLGSQPPLVPVAISIKIGGISHIRHAFDPVNEIRNMQLNGVEGGPLLIGHIKHHGGDLENAVQQSATVSNRPSSFSVIQTADELSYSASTPIGTITYGGTSGDQRNAIRLAGLPATFSILLGDTIGYYATEPMDSIQIQMTNASQPLTMDGDHFRYWVDDNNGEASLSAQISNVTSLQRLSPLVPSSSGPEGNSRIQLLRSSSSPFNIMMEDVSVYDDPFLGMNGKARLDPLPANITMAYPSSVDSTSLQLPDFGDGEGIEALSFFLGDLVDFGSVVNGFIHSMSMDFAGTSGNNEDMAIGINLETGEEFDITADFVKGTNLEKTPSWQHGLSMEIAEQTRVVFNLSRMPTFTLSSRQVVFSALEDGMISGNELDAVVAALEAANITDSMTLANALSDSIITEEEIAHVNLTKWALQGITLEDRRSWHLRSWLPNLPPGVIILEYDYRTLDGIPTYEIDVELNQWRPERQQLTFEVNGFDGKEIKLVLDGLDDQNPNIITANAVFSTQDNLTVPRVTVDMHYDIGARLNSAHAIFVDKFEMNRIEALIVGVPQSITNFSATIGDVLFVDIDVPKEHRIGDHSADALMLQSMRYVDGFWWPATVFMRDLPAFMQLKAQPHLVFDIREMSSFQGMMSLDYTSNTDDMDLYVEANGRAIDSKGNILMLAENLPSRFVLEPTEDWGMRVDSSGVGVKRVYIRQTDVPSAPGVTIDRIEIVGQDLKSATIHIYEGPLRYPIIVLDDITNGRIVVSAQATIEPGYYNPSLDGIELDGRAVLLDAQFIGVIPTASSMGINGIVTDLSLIGTLTGGAVETRHVMVVEPLTTILASGLAILG
ncbi:MAG: hypothetical protein HOL72_00280 [Euryarchaeota archaeon]|nr:hypothetical protein [Euryarchaeota archaeon]MBT5254184.1 hypothetical protein [Euryarchaeota archaeon]